MFESKLTQVAQFSGGVILRLICEGAAWRSFREQERHGKAQTPIRASDRFVGKYFAPVMVKASAPARALPIRFRVRVVLMVRLFSVSGFPGALGFPVAGDVPLSQRERDG